MTRFSKLEIVNGALVETNIRTIPQSALAKCPHCILVASHYRADNTCRCDDPDSKEMREWGYRWDAESKRWRYP